MIDKIICILAHELFFTNNKVLLISLNVYYEFLFFEMKIVISCAQVLAIGVLNETKSRIVAEF